MDKVIEALTAVQALHPEVCQVFFSVNGKWRYCDEEFEAPAFGAISDDLQTLLEEAADVVYALRGFPSAFYLPST